MKNEFMPRRPRSKAMIYPLFMLLLLLAPRMAIAGGAVIPFVQNWVVSWASTEDSIAFSKAMMPNIGQCDARSCKICKTHQAQPLKSWPRQDCEAHEKSEKHQCTPFEQQQGMVSIYGYQNLPSCHTSNCHSCLLKHLTALQQESEEVCTDHANGTAHHCTGYSIHQMTYHDANPALRIPIFLDGLVQDASPVVDRLRPVRDAANSDAIPVLERFRGTADAAITATTGLFALSILGFDEPIEAIQVTQEDGLLVMVAPVQSDASITFDLRNFPSSSYRFIAIGASGAYEMGHLRLQTRVSPLSYLSPFQTLDDLQIHD